MKKVITLVLLLALGLAAKVANADFTFGTPTNLGPTVNSSAEDWTPSISADGLELYFCSTRPGGYGGYDIWVTRRATTDDPWGTPVNLGSTVNGSADDAGRISADGLTFYLSSNRPGGYGDWDNWVTTRPTTSDPWGAPLNLGPPVNTSDWDVATYISSDGLTLFFCSNRPGGQGNRDVWVTSRATISDPWGIPVNLGPPVNTSYGDDTPPCLSADGLMLFFNSNRPGGEGGWDLWVTRRATISHPWGTPVNLGPTVNTSSTDYLGDFSADGSTLYFSSNRVGDHDLWQASIEPVVDLNGDGIVDSADMCIMIDYWGTDEPLCDIGPMPWGDGIVDVQDLIVLAEHLFEEIPRLNR